MFPPHTQQKSRYLYTFIRLHNILKVWIHFKETSSEKTATNYKRLTTFQE